MLTGREEHGEDAPVLAPVLHQYGRALLEHVVRVAGALGGATEDEEPHIDGNVGVNADESADISSKSLGKRKANEEEKEEEEEEGDDPASDDDLGLAFVVLDLSRVIYERILGENGESGSSSAEKAPSKPELHTITGEVLDERALRIELADVHNDLGDVGLENGALLLTENFEQASSDYGEALSILEPLLPPYARRLADAQLRLGLALEFHPDAAQRGNAESHVQQARAVLETRVDHLHKIEAGDTSDVPDELAKLSKDKVADELKDVIELIGDLNIKLEEFRTAPPTTAHDDSGKPVNPALEQAIREAFLGVQAEAFSRAPEQPVNDLSTRVKKKRK